MLSLPRMLALLLDIKLTLVEITARPQELVLSLPLEAQRQGWVLKLPEGRVQPQGWGLKLPEG
ncbi:hypothetical protein LEI94_01690 [Salmonella enterica]|nr:hypothetical protein [Salmonella enterica]